MFFDMSFKKNVKTRFLNFEKKVKYVFSNFAARWCTRVRFRALRFARGNVPLSIFARKGLARKRWARYRTRCLCDSSDLTLVLWLWQLVRDVGGCDDSDDTGACVCLSVCLMQLATCRPVSAARETLITSWRHCSDVIVIVDVINPCQVSVSVSVMSL